MSLISKSIPNFVNGVSQQPPSLRLESQGELQENALSSVINGLEKRPASHHIKDLGTITDMDDAFVHVMRRDENEAYLLVIKDNSLRIFDLTGYGTGAIGTEVNVYNGSGITSGDLLSANPSAYLNFDSGSSTALENIAFKPTSIAATTVADYTYVCNKEFTVKKKATTSITRPYEALIYIKGADYGMTFSVTVHYHDTDTTTDDYNTTFTTQYTLPDGTVQQKQSSSSTEASNAQLNNQGTTHSTNVAQALFDESPLVVGSITVDATSTDSPKPVVKTGEVISKGTTSNALRLLPKTKGFGVHYETSDGQLNASYETDAGVVDNDSREGGTGRKRGTTSIIQIYNTERPFSVEVDDGQGGTYITAVVSDGGTRSFADLPPSVPEAYDEITKKPSDNSSITYTGKLVTARVQGDKKSNQDDFYVQYDGEVWAEIAQPMFPESDATDRRKELDESTMPHTLVRNFYPGNAITSLTIAGGGTGYSAGTLSATGGGGSGFSGTYTVNESGVIDSVTITNTGSGYTTTPTIVISDSGGSSGNITPTIADTYYGLSATTYNLVYFDFTSTTYAPRKSGDNTTNPFPSFALYNETSNPLGAYTIRDVFFHRNRLGFISDENVIFSQAGDYTNFFKSTVIASPATNPIDVAVSNNQVSILEHAIPFQEQLILFSDLQQFKVGSKETLTPESVTIDVSTQFETSTDAKPVPAGKYIFFPFKRGEYSGIREYFVEENTDTNDAVEVTAHVPQYIPGIIRSMASSSNEEMVVCLSSSERKNIYVYKYYWQDRQKVQSSWSVWKSDGNIVAITFLGSEIYIVVNRSNKISIERIDLSTDSASLIMQDSQPILLDRRILLKYNAGTGGTVDSTSGLPLYSTLASAFPTGVPTGVEYIAETGELLGTDLAESVVTSYLENGTARWVAGGGASQSMRIFAGIPYTFKYKVSEQVVKEGESVLNLARLQLRNISFNYNKTGFFQVVVSPQPSTTEGRTARTITFSGNTIGTRKIDTQTLQEGTFKVPVLARSNLVDIELQNASHLPSVFQSAEWEGFMVLRSRRT